jgi:hypothetical protein
MFFPIKIPGYHFRELEQVTVFLPSSVAQFTGCRFGYYKILASCNLQVNTNPHLLSYCAMLSSRVEINGRKFSVMIVSWVASI